MFANCWLAHLRGWGLTVSRQSQLQPFLTLHKELPEHLGDGSHGRSHESASATLTGRQPARPWVTLASNRRKLWASGPAGPPERSTCKQPGSPLPTRNCGFPRAWRSASLFPPRDAVHGLTTSWSASLLFPKPAGQWGEEFTGH